MMMIVVEQLRIHLGTFGTRTSLGGAVTHEIQKSESSLGVFISKKLPGDANTADPKKRPQSARL